MDIKTARALVWRRCGGRCEISGKPLDVDTFDLHHRRNKGMGGTSRPDRDWPSNLLALDPDVHNGGPQSVHGRRAWSERRGYLVPKNVKWAGSVPVLIRGALWVFLGEDGQCYPPPPGLGIPVTGPLDDE